MIRHKNGEYYIEPSKYHHPSSHGGHTHVLYDRTPSMMNVRIFCVFRSKTHLFLYRSQYYRRKSVTDEENVALVIVAQRQTPNGCPKPLSSTNTKERYE